MVWTWLIDSLLVISYRIRPRPERLHPLLLAVCFQSRRRHTHHCRNKSTIVLRLSLESSRRAAQSLAETVKQLMNAMAATGMAADTPPFEPPRPMLTLSSCPATDVKDEEDSCDYRADDEDEGEVDNGSNFIPGNLSAGDSKTFGADEVKRVGDVNHQQATVDLTSDVSVLQEIHVEHHTVIQDTTVVTKYSYEDEEDQPKMSDNVHRDDQLTTLAVTTSSAVIDCMTVSTLESVATNDTRELGDGTSSDMSCNESQRLSTEGVLNLKLMQQPIDSSPYEKDDGKMIDDGQEEQVSAQNVLSRTNEDSLSDTGQVMEVEPEGDRVVDTPVRESEESRNDTKSESQDPLAAPLLAAERQSGAKGRLYATTATKPVKAAKRKQSVSPQRYSTEIADDDSTGDGGSPQYPAGSDASAQTTHTSKKQKKMPKSPQSTPLRRSTRVKVESPKFTYPPVKNRADHVKKSGGSSSATSGRYHVTTSKGVAVRRLKDSEVLGRGESHLDEGDDHEEKASTSSASATMLKRVTLEDGSSSALSLVHLMGTDALAAKVKHAFQRAIFSGNAPVFRFQQLINDNITGLRHLNVFNLLDAVSPLDGSIMQLHVKLPGVRRTTGQDRVDRVSKAKARSLESCPLRFPAPRRVAEQFIVPLAKELGLEYALRQHTASLMSCPLEEAVLDWRFHQTETVVFQLGGKSIWNMKMSQVEHPLQCFHPNSWQLDDLTHVTKIHRVATMDKASLGFLSTPAEDVDVFDEKGDEEATLQGHHLLKPGSVAYIPAGAWFEVTTQGPNALWIEVQLASMTYENLVFSALKQLAWGDKQWRMGVQLYPGNRGRFQATRHHVEACLKSLRNEMIELEGGDLLPEYFGTEDMQDLVARGLIHDTSTSPNMTKIEVDLTNPKFKLKHEKVFKDAAYRVNPVALLISVAEIPHLPVQGVKPARTSETERTSHRALKKTSKPNPKQKMRRRTLTQRDKHTYTLDELFGNDEFRSQLHVKFQCSAEHSRMVEWLRFRGSEPFNLEELSRFDPALRHDTSPTRGNESARNLLRFLCFVGYVTRLKSP